MTRLRFDELLRWGPQYEYGVADGGILLQFCHDGVINALEVRRTSVGIFEVEDILVVAFCAEHWLVEALRLFSLVMTHQP